MDNDRFIYVTYIRTTPERFASLKSLLETGESLEATRRWPEGL